MTDLALSALRDLPGGDQDNPILAATTALAGPTDGAQAVIGGDHGAIQLGGRVTWPEVNDGTLLRWQVDLRDVTLVTARGGRFEAVHPPLMSGPVTRTIHPGLIYRGRAELARIEFGSSDGRSSDGDLPFFLLTTPARSAGAWIAVGHGGGWRARLQKEPNEKRHTLTVWLAHGEVRPPEGGSVELPAIHVGAWSNGAGWEAVKDYIRARRPRAIQPPVVYNTWFNLDAEVDTAALSDAIGHAAAIGCEVFCLDAGWYVGDRSGPDDFQTAGIGTWEIDRSRFSDGLAPLAAQARGAGMGFGLWFEMERAHPESWVARAHPEWLRWADGEEFAVVDFGVEDAADWALDIMSTAVGELDLAWLKWDSNHHHMGRFFHGDAAGEIAHCAGVRRVAHTLMARHPELVLEGCASGGNRMDVESLAACHTYWVTDQTMNPALVATQMANTARWLPAQYRFISASPQRRDADQPVTDAAVVAAMTGPLGVMLRLPELTTEERDMIASHITTHKAVRHLLDGAATVFPPDRERPLASWVGVELSGPEGAVLLADRQACPAAEATFSGARTWRVEAPPGGARIDHVRADRTEA